MRVACWISKTTSTKTQAHARSATRHPHARNHACAFSHAHTHTYKYALFIAFPLQQSFRERASVLRYTYIACLVIPRWRIQSFKLLNVYLNRSSAVITMCMPHRLNRIFILSSELFYVFISVIFRIKLILVIKLCRLASRVRWLKWE